VSTDLYHDEILAPRDPLQVLDHSIGSSVSPTVTSPYRAASSASAGRDGVARRRRPRGSPRGIGKAVQEVGFEGVPQDQHPEVLV
jgi:hypothetical protein